MSDFKLPSAPDVERYVLGAVICDSSSQYALAELTADDFSIELSHRRILAAAQDLHASGSPVDRVTVAKHLQSAGHLESAGGLSYLVGLDEGLPKIYNLDAYIEILRKKATLRGIIAAATGLISRCSLDEDPTEILGDSEQILRRLGESRVESPWLQPGQIVEQYPGGFEAFMSGSSGAQMGIKTPWVRLNDMTCGLQHGELVLVAGRPSHGKSAWALNLAYHAVRNGKGVAFFSLEMAREWLVQRLISIAGRIDLLKLRHGYLTAEERRKVMVVNEQISKLPIYILDPSAQPYTLRSQLAALRKLRQRAVIDMVVVDHLHLMRTNAKAERHDIAVGEISSEWKRAAGEFKIPVVMVAQLSRDCEKDKRRPVLSDLRDSGRLEQDADTVLFVFREELYHEPGTREDLRGLADLILAKQRNGPVGDVPLVWLNHIQTFENRADAFYGEHERDGKYAAAG